MAKRPAFQSDGHEKSVALLFNANAGGTSHVGLNLIGPIALVLPILKRSESITMQSGIDISRVGIETLPDDEARFPVRLFAGAKPANRGRQAHVSGHALPDIMKGIFRAPHVLAAAGDEISFPFCVILDRPRMSRLAYIGVRFEKTHRRVRPQLIAAQQFEDNNNSDDRP